MTKNDLIFKFTEDDADTREIFWEFIVVKVLIYIKSKPFCVQKQKKNTPPTLQRKNNISNPNL